MGSETNRGNGIRWHRVRALLYKYFCITRNRVDRIFDIFFWPTIDLLLWGFASQYVASTSQLNLNFLTIFLGGIILWSLVWSTTRDISLYVLEDFWGRNLYNQYASPLTSRELVVSLLIWATLRTAASFAILLALAHLFYQFKVFVIAPAYLALFGGLLVFFGWTIGLLLASLVFRFGMRVQVLTWSFAAVLMPFSCVMYPLASIPLWAQPIARVLPTTQIFESMRALLFQGTPEKGALLYAFLATLVLFLGMLWLFKTSVDSARMRGDFTRYG